MVFLRSKLRGIDPKIPIRGVYPAQRGFRDQFKECCEEAEITGHKKDSVFNKYVKISEEYKKLEMERTLDSIPAQKKNPD